jgi:hypothetical protein
MSLTQTGHVAERLEWASLRIAIFREWHDRSPILPPAMLRPRRLEIAERRHWQVSGGLQLGAHC